MDVNVLVEKLNGMSVWEIREYLVGVGAKGRMSKAYSCVIADHIFRVTGALVSVSPYTICSSGGTYLNCSESLADFICEFDLGKYPELVRVM